MKIQDALKETGKAVFPREVGVYAEITFDRGANFLSWVDIESKTHEGIVAYETHFSDDWLPYHEEKEIRPEKAGELWQDEYSGQYFHTEDRASAGCGLCLVGYGSIGYQKVASGKFIHGKNGWTRLYPPVEDEGVERIEICPKVKEYHKRETEYTFVIPDGLLERVDSQNLILEIPKDSK